MSIRAKVAPLFANLRTSNFFDRVTARRTGKTARRTRFITQPEPRTVGGFERGKQLIAGNYHLGGHLVQSPGRNIWAVEAPDLSFETELHGFTWLDDLAAVSDLAARGLAQDWLRGWIERFGNGNGPGWSPDLTGRRLTRWINHGVFLRNDRDPELMDRYFKSLAHQTLFLSKRWTSASPGLPRFEALTGLLYAGLMLEGMDRQIYPALKALGRECADQIDAEGGLPRRNAEELMEVLTLLTWAQAALIEAGQKPEPEHVAAIERIVPTLRALRHSDGGLARFHGGGGGLDGRLDQALALAGGKAVPREGVAMGYLRLACMRSTVISDVAVPPEDALSFDAHASTLGFELTSGRRQLVVNCGSGTPFSIDWQRASRATASHSALVLDGKSSSLIDIKAKPALIKRPPSLVMLEHGGDEDSQWCKASHDGYVTEYGLVHGRILDLSNDGRVLSGDDTLELASAGQQSIYDKMAEQAGPLGIPFHLRFHLHPNVEAEMEPGGAAITLTLKSGEVWTFKAQGHAGIDIEPTVYLEKGIQRPRACKQIVLSGRVMEYAAKISWNFAKAQETPSYLRDYDEEP